MTGEGKHFSFLFFSTTEISYLIIGLWHLLEPIPLWRENSLCAAQLKPLQFVNLPLLVPGPPGGEPDVQWVTQIPRTLQDRPQGEGEQSHAALFSKHQNKEWMQPWHFTTVIWYVDTSLVFSNCATGQNRSHGSTQLKSTWSRVQEDKKFFVAELDLKEQRETWPLVNHRSRTDIWRANSCYLVALMSWLRLLNIDKVLTLFTVGPHGDDQDGGKEKWQHFKRQTRGATWLYTYQKGGGSIPASVNYVEQDTEPQISPNAASSVYGCVWGRWMWFKLKKI